MTRKPLRGSRSFAVTTFDTTNRDLVCDVLLENMPTTNLHPISHRYQDMASVGQVFDVDGGANDD